MVRYSTLKKWGAKLKGANFVDKAPRRVLFPNLDNLNCVSDNNIKIIRPEKNKRDNPTIKIIHPVKSKGKFTYKGG